MSRIFTIIAMSTVLAGCASSIKVMRYTETVFPPTSEVEVLTEKPTAEFTEIAELSVKAKEDAVLRLRRRAMELGADAIILLGEESRGAVAVPIGSSVYAVPIRRVRALAIRFEGPRS